MKIKKNRIIKLVIATAMIVLSFVCFYSVKNMDILPNKYLTGFATILFIINLFGLVFLVMKGVLNKIFCSIVYLILVFVSIVGIKYSKSTIDYLNTAFNNNKEINTYDVIVLKSSKYEKIEDLKNKTVGYILSEMEDEKYLKKLEETVDVDFKSFSIFKLYENLLDEKVDAILINEGYIDLLEEQFSDFSSKTNIIYTYTMEEETVEIVDNNQSEKPKNYENSINIYLSGSDSRSNYIESVSRSDVNIIITINPDKNIILLTNIPRDYYVQLHGTTGLRDKLTHAGIYGINMSKQTIEDLFDINIDYTVKVGFNGVIQLIDLIDGIDIDSDSSFTCYTNSSVYVNKGWNHFNGTQALAYARERYAYVDGDRHRGANQQQVIEATFTKISKDKSLLLKYDSLLNALGSLYITDIPKDVITNLIKYQIDKMPSWKIESQAVDGYNSSKQTYSMPGSELYVMEPDYNSVNKAANRIIELY